MAQWGDPAEKDAERRPLPADVVKVPAAEYDIAGFAPAQRLIRADAYSNASGITADGWPVATDGTASWITHCYGSVGVARDSSPDTGSGSELPKNTGSHKMRRSPSAASASATTASGRQRHNAPSGLSPQTVRSVAIAAPHLSR